MTFTLTKRFDFEAAHQLPWHNGKCKNLHGHSYKLEVDIEGELNENGIVEDFYEVSKICKGEIVNVYDHKLLNDYFENPTAEVMAREFFNIIDKHWVNGGFSGRLSAVRLWETENSWVQYKPYETKG